MVLILELVPNPDELTEADRAPIGSIRYALYSRSVPERNGVGPGN